MKARNYTYYSKDKDLLKRLAEEYRLYSGRDYKLYDDRIVVFALPRPKRKPVKEEKSDKPERYTKRERDFG